MSQKKSLFLWSVILYAILHTLHVNGFTRSSTHSCAGYNEECDFSKLNPCCDTNLKCKTTSSRLEKVCLEPAKIGLLCYNDGDCDDIRHAKCSSTKQCVCRSNNIKVNETYCAPLLGAFCWNNEPCANANATCVDAICQCKENYLCSSNHEETLEDLQSKKRAQMEIGSTCEDDIECANIRFAVCSVNQKCSCPNGTFPINSQTCQSDIHNSCVQDSDCLFKNSSCIDEKCSCNPGFIILDGECQPVYVGMPCTYDRDCHHHIPFSKCSTKNKCTCIDHYHLSDNRCVLGFTVLCSRTIPCSNPNFACVNDMCQCPANYTLWNSRCLSTTLGSFCNTDDDCIVIEFSKCSNDQKCICKTNYEENKGICIPLIGEFCVLNEDCLPINSLCINNKCSCNTNFSKNLNNKCFPTKLGFSCQKDEDCFLIPHSKCTFRKCVCEEKYTRQNANCAPLLGSFCSTNDVCAVDNSVCIDDICQCDINYEEQSNDYCMLVTLTKPCNNSTICPAFSTCSTKKICRCQLNYGAKNDSVCAPLLHQPCSTLCLANHSICLDGICQCEINYVPHSSSICKLDYFDSTVCWKNSDCYVVKNAICDDTNTNKCFCDKNYIKLNGVSCAPLLIGNCLVNKDCVVENSICHLNICKCKPKYFEVSNHECQPRSLGAKCRYNRDCRSILNSQCSLSSICTCKFQHVAMNEFSCVPVVGGYCTGDLNCDSRTMECVANKCRCKPNFTEMSATLCIETTNVYSCIEPSECSDSWHFTCSPNKKCVCQTNNTAINHATCLPTLGGLCWKDDQCMAKKSSCVDYRCACKEGYIRAADNFCATAD